MATEIERKFLVKGTDFKSLAEPKHFRQGYLSTEPERTVRVRAVNDKGFLTIKGKNQGISRTEFEYEIPVAEATEMLSKLALPTVIEKKRYRIEYKGKIWEVDEFLGENEGLTIAEIELNSTDEEFEKPSWIGEEVSYDIKYYNSYLSEHPFKGWK